MHIQAVVHWLSQQVVGEALHVAPVLHRPDASRGQGSGDPTTERNAERLGQPPGLAAVADRDQVVVQPDKQGNFP